MQIIGYNLGADLFGSPISAVQEIIRPAPVTHLPNTPDFVEGVIIFRTNIIPLIDMHKKLNIVDDPAETNNSRFLILNIQDMPACIKVDSVTGIHQVESPSPDEPGASSPGQAEEQYIKEVCRVGELQIKILDFDKVLDSEERDRLGSIVTGHQGT